MENKVFEYIESFKELSKSDKKEEILKNIYELRDLFYKINNVPILVNRLENYEDDNEVYNELFKEIIVIKEMTAEILKKTYMD